MMDSDEHEAFEREAIDTYRDYRFSMRGLCVHLNIPFHELGPLLIRHGVHQSYEEFEQEVLERWQECRIAPSDANDFLGMSKEAFVQMVTQRGIYVTVWGLEEELAELREELAHERQERSRSWPKRVGAFMRRVRRGPR